VCSWRLPVFGSITWRNRRRKRRFRVGRQCVQSWQTRSWVSFFLLFLSTVANDLLNGWPLVFVPSSFIYSQCIFHALHTLDDLDSLWKMTSSRRSHQLSFPPTHPSLVPPTNCLSYHLRPPIWWHMQCCSIYRRWSESDPKTRYNLNPNDARDVVRNPNTAITSRPRRWFESDLLLTLKNDIT
jgi:hypothetical protein